MKDRQGAEVKFSPRWRVKSKTEVRMLSLDSTCTREGQEDGGS